jgi:hypothetical protein
VAVKVVAKLPIEELDTPFKREVDLGLEGFTINEAVLVESCREMAEVEREREMAAPVPPTLTASEDNHALVRACSSVLTSVNPDLINCLNKMFSPQPSSIRSISRPISTPISSTPLSSLHSHAHAISFDAEQVDENNENSKPQSNLPQVRIRVRVWFAI